MQKYLALAFLYDFFLNTITMRLVIEFLLILKKGYPKVSFEMHPDKIFETKCSANIAIPYKNPYIHLVQCNNISLDL